MIRQMSSDIKKTNTLLDYNFSREMNDRKFVSHIHLKVL